jgi:endonuclease/exonuclease/phosphatase family metal-dependent hydrolase
MKERIHLFFFFLGRKEQHVSRHISNKKKENTELEFAEEVHCFDQHTYMSTFRLATLNVHSFLNSYSFIDGNESSLLASILQPFNLDLIAVQEIQNNDEWKKFCLDLSFPYSTYGECNGDSFGNGIASRYPIVSPVNQQSLIKSERRSLLQCRLDGDHPFIQNRVFAVTHLDHLNEDDRLKQIKGFDSFHDTVDILMGDMN